MPPKISFDIVVRNTAYNLAQFITPILITGCFAITRWLYEHIIPIFALIWEKFYILFEVWKWPQWLILFSCSESPWRLVGSRICSCSHRTYETAHTHTNTCQNVLETLLSKTLLGSKYQSLWTSPFISTLQAGSSGDWPRFFVPAVWSVGLIMDGAGRFVVGKLRSWSASGNKTFVH